ncbi:MAG: YncE family protein [Planctomycetes bacterium]|nr:YncE family protein [Planctomycetota bacterium]
MNTIQACISLLTAAALSFAGDSVNYKKEREVPMPGGSFDYLNVDTASRRMYVAHSTKIDVVDLDKSEKIGEVEGVEGAHGATVVAEFKRGFATAGRKNMLIVFDPVTLKVTKEIPTGTGPDAILYVTTTKEVWSMNHRAGTITCVDASTLEVKSTIEVGGMLEFAAEHVSKGMVYVNSEDKNFIAQIDAKKHAVVSKFALAPCEAPTGLAIDEKNGILFAGCDQKLAIVDTANGKVVATPEIGKGCDAVVFDAERMLAFASCGDGTTAVVKEVDPKKFEIVGKIETARGAKTCAFDPKTRKLWFPQGSRTDTGSKLLVFAPEEAKKPEKQ